MSSASESDDDMADDDEDEVSSSSGGKTKTNSSYNQSVMHSLSLYCNVFLHIYSCCYVIYILSVSQYSALFFTVTASV